MFVQALLLMPVLLVAAVLLFKRLPGVSTLIMMVGAGVMVVGGLYTAVWVGLNGDTSQVSHQLTIGGAVSIAGFLAFTVGFLFLALHVATRQATDDKKI
jgi:hypothetical protein